MSVVHSGRAEPPKIIMQKIIIHKNLDVCGPFWSRWTAKDYFLFLFLPK
jgi:hypothetical protein